MADFKTLNGFNVKDEQARNNIAELEPKQSDYINLQEIGVDITGNIDCSSILENNKNKIKLIPKNGIIKAGYQYFTEQNLKNFYPQGKISFVPEANETISITERDLSIQDNPLYKSMFFPSEFLNNIKWKHQRQSWLWQDNYNMANKTNIVPWFQIFKNPNAQLPTSGNFSVNISDFTVLAFNSAANIWTPIIKVPMSNIDIKGYNWYDNDDGSETIDINVGTNQYSKILNINWVDLSNYVIHGFLGTQLTKFIASNSYYRYIAFSLTLSTSAGDNIIGANLGCDLKNTSNPDLDGEIGGTRTIFLSKTPKTLYFCYSLPTTEEFMKIYKENIFEKFNLQNFILNKFVGNAQQFFELKPNNTYMLNYTNNDNTVYGSFLVICPNSSSTNPIVVQLAKNGDSGTPHPTITPDVVNNNTQQIVFAPPSTQYFYLNFSKFAPSFMA